MVELVAQPLHSLPKDAKLVQKLDLDDSVLSHREDLLTKAVSMNMRHPPTLPEFHGNQLTKNSVAFEGWCNRVLQVGQAGYMEDQVMAAISCSCREDALVALTQLQTGTVPIMVKQVLSEFGSLFSRSAEDDSLVKQLFNIKQGESELVNSYYLHLCALLNVVVNCPDYPLDRDFTQRQQFFHGLRVEIQGSLRYLYEDSKVTAVELLQKAQAVEAEFAGGDQQLRGRTAKAQEAADQPGKATSVVVQQSKVSADECKPWSTDILKMITMIKSLATSVDKIHKKLVKNKERKECVVTQTAEVVSPPQVMDGNLQDPGQQQWQQQPPWWKRKVDGLRPQGFKPWFLRRVNTTPTGCYRCEEEGHFARECMSEQLPTVPRMDVPVWQQQQAAAPTSPES